MNFMNNFFTRCRIMDNGLSELKRRCMKTEDFIAHRFGKYEKVMYKGAVAEVISLTAHGVLLRRGNHSFASVLPADIELIENDEFSIIAKR